MEKLQILFPEPQLEKLRKLATIQDRPVSELVRAAVDLWISRAEPFAEEARERPPLYHCGAIQVSRERLRDSAYENEEAP